MWTSLSNGRGKHIKVGKKIKEDKVWVNGK